MPTLIDGREVAKDSADWRDECLARYVLDQPDGTRGAWMRDFARRHGEAPAEHLADLVRRVREHRAAKARQVRDEMLPRRVA